MDPKPRRELATLIAQEGVGLAEDPQRIKALLMDRCPESRTEMGLLVAAAEDDIPSRLARSSGSIFRDGEISRAVMDLKHTRRLDENAAEWVVRSWAWALGIVDEEPADDLDSGAQPSPLAPEMSPTQEETSTGPSPSPTGVRHSEPPTIGQSGSYPAAGPDQVWAAPSSPSQPSGPYSNTSSPHGPGFPSGPTAQSSPPSWMFDQTPTTTAAAWQGSAGDPSSPNDGWGPPPVQPPNAPPPAGNPPRGPQRNLLAIVGGAVLVVVVLVGAGIWAKSVFSQTDSPQPSTSSVAPIPPTAPPTSAARVNVQIVDTLADWEISETVTVLSGGQELGKLKVDTTSPTDSLSLRAPPGMVAYQLDVWFAYTDTNTGEVVDQTISGEGSINCYEGAKYAVVLKGEGGGFVAALREVTT